MTAAATLERWERHGLLPSTAVEHRARVVYEALRARLGPAR